MEQRINQIQLFEIAAQSEEIINTFLYEIQKYTNAQIVSTSVSDGVVLVEYTVSVEHVKGIEEKNGKDK